MRTDLKFMVKFIFPNNSSIRIVQRKIGLSRPHFFSDHSALYFNWNGCLYKRIPHHQKHSLCGRGPVSGGHSPCEQSVWGCLQCWFHGVCCERVDGYDLGTSWYWRLDAAGHAAAKGTPEQELQQSNLLVLAISMLSLLESSFRQILLSFEVKVVKLS